MKSQLLAHIESQSNSVNPIRMATPIRILAASSSADRRRWYEKQLRLYGIKVTTAVDGIDCIRNMREQKPEVLLLEPLLSWGGSQGVLAVLSEEPEFQDIPVVLIAVDGVSLEWFQLSRYSVQDLIVRRTSGRKLSAALHAATGRQCKSISSPQFTESASSNK